MRRVENITSSNYNTSAHRLYFLFSLSFAEYELTFICLPLLAYNGEPDILCHDLGDVLENVGKLAEEWLCSNLFNNVHENGAVYYHLRQARYNLYEMYRQSTQKADYCSGSERFFIQ